MSYCVSYSLHNGWSGNKSFPTIEKAKSYIRRNKKDWKSYTLYQYESGHLVTELKSV